MIFVIHHFGPSNSGHFLLGTQRKMLQRFNIFWGEIGYSPNFPWILGLRASAGAVYLDFFGIQTFPSPWPTCASYTNCTVESRGNFQLENLQNRLEMGSNRRSCDLFSKEIMQFCTGEGFGCPLPSRLVGTMLRFDL